MRQGQLCVLGDTHVLCPTFSSDGGELRNSEHAFLACFSETSDRVVGESSVQWDCLLSVGASHAE